jgi:hypothetical protein
MQVFRLMDYHFVLSNSHEWPRCHSTKFSKHKRHARYRLRGNRYRPNLVDEINSNFSSWPDELLEMQITTPGLNMQQFLHVIVQFAPGNQGRFGCEKEVSDLACSISNMVELSSALRDLHVPKLYQLTGVPHCGQHLPGMTQTVSPRSRQDGQRRPGT